MTPKNVDETIKKLLDTYAKHCKTILDEDKKRIDKHKYKSEDEYNRVNKEYDKANEAYEFLIKISENPKKYLYSGKDIVYAQDPDDGQYLYDKLNPILNGKFDCFERKHLIARLSEIIAWHVSSSNYNPNSDWICYFKDKDLDAEKVFALNADVQLHHGIGVVNSIKAIFCRPSVLFAVNHVYDKNK